MQSILEKKYDMTFQMTVGKSHDIKQHGYDLLYKKPGGESAKHEIHHYFVVSKDIFPETTVHSEKGRKRSSKNVMNVKSWTKERIKQYALLLGVGIKSTN